MDVENGFDFSKWIVQYGLKDLAQCFIDHQMITLDSLDMNHPNFAKLMADETVLSHSHLIQHIVNGIQSLEKLKNAPKDDSIQTRLIFMTQNENKIFFNLERYINHLNDLHQEFEQNIKISLKDRKQQNTQRLEKYEQQNKQKLENITDDINKTMDKLHDILNLNEKVLQNEINEYKQDIKQQNEIHKRIVKHIDNTLQTSISIIEQDIKYYHKSIKQCKDIVSKYEDIIDDDVDDYSIDNNKNREQEIVKIGETAKKYYDKNMLVFNDNKSKINEYIDTQLLLNMNEIYSVHIYDTIYSQICNNINNKLIILRNDEDDTDDENDKFDDDNKQQEEYQDIILHIPHKSKHKIDQIAEDIHNTNQIQHKLEESLDLIGNDIPSAILGASVSDSELLNFDHLSTDAAFLFADGQQPPPPTDPPPAFNPYAKSAKLRKKQKSAPVAEKEKVDAPPIAYHHFDSPKIYQKPNGPNPLISSLDLDDDNKMILKEIIADQQMAYEEAKQGADGEEFESYWSCSVCTFNENPGTYLVCKLCSSTRQLSMPIQRQHSQSVPPVMIQQSKFKERRGSSGAHEPEHMEMNGEYEDEWRKKSMNDVEDKKKKKSKKWWKGKKSKKKKNKK